MGEKLESYKFSGNIRWQRGLALFAGSSLLLIAFNNCSSRHEQVQNASTWQGQGGVCEVTLQKEFQSLVHPFFSSRCVECHVEGGKGFGAFASPNLDTAFEAFQAKSLSQLAMNAASDAHYGSITGGARNRNAWASIEKSWPEKESEYLQCLSKSGSGGLDESILTSGKREPLLYSVDTPRTLTWNLSLGSDLDPKATRSLPVRVSLNVKVLYQGTGASRRATGYEFSRPSVSLLNSSTNLIAEGMYIYINGKLVASQTAFAFVSRLISGTTPILLAEGTGATLIEPVSTSDTFGVFFQRLVLTNDVDGSSPPPTPILGMGDVGSNNQLTPILVGAQANVSILRDFGVIRWCLSHLAQTPPASTEAPCEGGEGSVNGWHFLQRPTQIPIDGPDGEKTYYLWVANASLKISAIAAEQRVQRDTQAPAAPQISLVDSSNYLEKAYPTKGPGDFSEDTSKPSLGDLPIARIRINHTNKADISGWCVKNDGATPEANDDCWRWRWDRGEPNNAPLPRQGDNLIYVFVRDRAGNISAASNVLRANNTAGVVSHNDLISNRAMGVFQQRCAYCHEGNQSPGFQQLRIWELAHARRAAQGGDASILVSRTNDELRPMPNLQSKLMEEKYRQILRMWARDPY